MTRSRHLPLAELNDRLRKTLVRGHIIVTPGIRALALNQQCRILEAVRSYSDFSEHNDPYGDHDFGIIALDGLPKVYWKIDHLNNDMTGGSLDPHDETITVSILTIYLASEH